MADYVKTVEAMSQSRSVYRIKYDASIETRQTQATNIPGRRYGAGD